MTKRHCTGAGLAEMEYTPWHNSTRPHSSPGCQGLADYENGYNDDARRAACPGHQPRQAKGDPQAEPQLQPDHLQLVGLSVITLAAYRPDREINSPVESPLQVIGNIDFGKLAAENDIGPVTPHSPPTRGLERYFFESGDYRSVRSGNNTIVLGNRGSGKSAIFQILARTARSEGTHVIELSPDDYSYEMLHGTMASESSGSWKKQGAYAAAWKYVIYTLVLKEVTKKGQRLKRGTLSRIYNYLQDNNQSADVSAISMLVSYLKSIESVKLGPLGELGISRVSKARAQELERLYNLEELRDILDSLKKVLAKDPVFIFIDELDRGWDSSEDAQAFVAGLFQACLQVNRLHENLRVYISLRQELFASNRDLVNDAQKYRDILGMIRWSEESLLALIAKRIRYSAEQRSYGNSFAHVSDLACWEWVFAAPPGGSARDSFAYMADRTLCRPREIIHFCTRVIDVVKSAHGDMARLPVPFSAVRSAERIYSSERAGDIAGEYSHQYPGLMSIFEVFRGRSHAFDRQSLQMLCLELATGEIPTDSEASPWLVDLDPDRLISILWNIGFLVAQPVRADKPIDDVRSFLGAHQAPHFNLAAAQYFHVHPMFWSYLGLEAEIGT